MAVIGELAVNVVAKTEKFSRGMKSARTEVSLFQKSTKALQGSIVGLAGGLAGALTLGSIRATVAEIEDLADAAERLGTTAQKLAGLQHAGFMADVSDG